MIRGIFIVNRSGKPRLVKFYENKLNDSQIQEFIIEIYFILLKRSEDSCNIIDSTDLYKVNNSPTKLIYRIYGSFYFVMIVDKFENDLIILDLIQLFLQCLIKSLTTITEEKLVFEHEKVIAILDEIICGGIVMETNFSEICTQVQAQELIAQKNNNDTLKQAQMKLKSWVSPLKESLFRKTNENN